MARMARMVRMGDHFLHHLLALARRSTDAVEQNTAAAVPFLWPWLLWKANGLSIKVIFPVVPHKAVAEVSKIGSL